MANVQPMPSYRRTPKTGGGQFSENYISEEIQRKVIDAELHGSCLAWKEVEYEVIESSLPANVLAAYRIPYFNADGSCITKNGFLHYFSTKFIFGPDATLEQRKDKYKRVHHSIAGQYNNHPYMSKHYHSMWSEDTKILRICEGEKKAACVQTILQEPCIAIGGCSSWSERDENDERQVKPALLRECNRGVEIWIYPDADITRMDMNKEYTMLTTKLREKGLVVRLMHPSDKVDDLMYRFMSEGNGDTEYAREQFALIPEFKDGVYDHSLLVANYGLFANANTGQVYPNQSNFRKLLRAPELFDRLWTNLDNGRNYYGLVECRQDLEEVDIADFIQHNLSLPRATPNSIYGAIHSVAKQNSRSPFLEKVKAVEWDGVERLESMFIEYCGCPDNEVSREVGAKWLVASLWRQIEPGCKVDYMVIAQGEQGTGKSSFPGIIFGDNNVVAVMGMKSEIELARQMHGGLCINLEELDVFKGKGTSTLKATVTCHVDSIRPHFKNHYDQKPRRSVLYGSTNDGTFLSYDESGHRRFAVLEFGQVQFKELEAYRWQLWAEAMAVGASMEWDGIRGRWGNIDSASESAAKFVRTKHYIEAIDDYFSDRDWLNRAKVRGMYFWTREELAEIAGLTYEPGTRGGRGDWDVENLFSHLSSSSLSVPLNPCRMRVLSGTKTQKVQTRGYKLDPKCL